MHTHRIDSDLSSSYDCQAADARIAELEAERNRLRKTLTEYGDHTPGCYRRNAPSEPRGCNCKWETSKKEVLGHD